MWKISPEFLISGTLDEHMHLLLPALIRLFKVNASVEIRRAAIKTLTRLIPCVQVGCWPFSLSLSLLFCFWWTMSSDIIGHFINCFLFSLCFVYLFFIRLLVTYRLLHTTWSLSWMGLFLIFLISKWWEI